MYGSMSSLPSVSSIGSRHLYNNKDKRAREERKLSMKGYQDVLLMIFLSCDISVTPPLPALSPSQSANQTPQSSPDFRLKYKLNQSGNNKPDLLENENLKKFQVSRVREGEGRGWVRVR